MLSRSRLTSYHSFRCDDLCGSALFQVCEPHNIIFWKVDKDHITPKVRQCKIHIYTPALRLLQTTSLRAMYSHDLMLVPWMKMLSVWGVSDFERALTMMSIARSRVLANCRIVESVLIIEMHAYVRNRGTDGVERIYSGWPNVYIMGCSFRVRAYRCESICGFACVYMYVLVHVCEDESMWVCALCVFLFCLRLVSLVWSICSPQFSGGVKCTHAIEDVAHHGQWLG